MKKFKFIENAGVPLTNEILDAIQQAYSIYSLALGFVGNFTIIQGCEDNGTQVNPGVVFINNEVYYFEGGVKSDKVYISEEKIYREFKDKVARHLISDFKVKFGNSVNAYNWADFIRIEKLKDLQAKVNTKVNQTDFDTLQTTVTNLSNGLQELFLKAAVFTAGGGMVFWRKPAVLIPQGWAEVVDWRRRIGIGYDPTYQFDPAKESENYGFDNLGKTGGEASHKLTKDELANHNHGFDYGSYTRGTGGSNTPVAINGNAGTSYTKGEGGDKPHNNMPPYRVVMYIEWVGI